MGHLRLVVDNTKGGASAPPAKQEFGFSVRQFEQVLVAGGYREIEQGMAAEVSARAYAKHDTYVVVNDDGELILGGNCRSEAVEMQIEDMTQALLRDLLADSWGARRSG